MRIGLTYDLRKQYHADGWSDEATSKLDNAETIDAIAAALTAVGHTVVHVGHAPYLIDKMAAGERLDLVFNVCEGVSGLARQAQVPAILDVYGIPYTFADPVTLSTSAHRGNAKALLRDWGIATADSWTIESLDDLRRVQGPFPLFVKPVTALTGFAASGPRRVEDAAELSKACCQLLGDCARPMLVETYLPGRHFIVGILGSGPSARVPGTLESQPTEQPGGDAEHRSNVVRLCDSREPLIDRIERTALAAWQVLRGRDAGCVELRLDAEGAPQVLEVQTLPSLHPQRAALPTICQTQGISFAKLVESIIESACRRADQQITTLQSPRPKRPHMMAADAKPASVG